MTSQTAAQGASALTHVVTQAKRDRCSFFDLPVEVRDSIHSFHFAATADGSDLVSGLKQVLICMHVNRNMRKEVLPCYIRNLITPFRPCGIGESPWKVAMPESTAQTAASSSASPASSSSNAATTTKMTTVHRIGFFDLPGEIRNMIYDLIECGPRPLGPRLLAARADSCAGIRARQPADARGDPAAVTAWRTPQDRLLAGLL